MDRHWRQRLERAEFETERAKRQYNLCETENRLVARELEREWEEALTALRHLREEYDRFRTEKPKRLTATERDHIRQLADDIPSLWHDERTTAQVKRTIVRELIDSIVVNVVGESERVKVGIRWAGGDRTETETIRPVARADQLSYYPELCDRVRQLAGEGKTARQIAGQLNREGFRPARGREAFGRQGVLGLMHREGIRPTRRKPEDQNRLQKLLRPDERTMSPLARELDMPRSTLYVWKQRGWIQTRTLEVGRRRRVVVIAGEEELERLKRLRALPRGYHARRRWIGGPDERLPQRSGPKDGTT